MVHGRIQHRWGAAVCHTVQEEKIGGSHTQNPTFPASLENWDNGAAPLGDSVEEPSLSLATVPTAPCCLSDGHLFYQDPCSDCSL